MYSHSFDEGKIFSPPLQVVNPDSDYGNSGSLAVSGNYLYLLYLARLDTFPWGKMVIKRSTDAGCSWEPPERLVDLWPIAISAKDSSVYVLFDYNDSLNDGYAGMMVSHDYGITWQTIALGLPLVPTGGKDKMVITPLGIHYVYDLYPHDYAEEVGYIGSTDFGYHWSAPRTLSTDDGQNSQLATIAADNNGNVYVVWNDQKYGGDFSGTILMRRSVDNGATWQHEQIISDPIIAVTSSISVYDSVVSITWDKEYEFGDTGMIGIRTSSNSGATWCPIQHIATDSEELGDPDISYNGKTFFLSWFKRINDQLILFETHSLVPEKSDTLLTGKIYLVQNYPNPFNNSTDFEFKIFDLGWVTLKIYDLLGREVTTLVDESMQPGIYRREWNASSFASGVYYYQLSTGKNVEIKKMILSK